MADRDDHNVKEHGCSLDENTRMQYLKAMGIQPWFERYADVSSLTDVEDFPVSSVENNLQPNDVRQSQLDSRSVTDIAPGDTVKEKNEVPDVSRQNWQQLKTTVSQCQLCELHISRTQTVFGAGNPAADLLIIGEAPGADEDAKGEPFVGRAGQLLDAMLKAIDLDRPTVFITNVLKCQPPNNRNPHTSEIVCCDPYLQRQIELIQPKVILALGRIAAHHLLISQEPLGAMRQRQHSYNGIPLLVSYHPAYLLRKPVDKRKSWQDLLQVKKQLTSL
ncbi:MAG: uracil-DNA glycosylase [Gammaproteobacteria bacterium]|nr:uracil-DNA glycosylase [Gammaproteobacteria bacterium]